MTPAIAPWRSPRIATRSGPLEWPTPCTDRRASRGLEEEFMNERTIVALVGCLMVLVYGCGDDGRAEDEMVQKRANALSAQCGLCVGDATAACVQNASTTDLA